MYIFGKHNTEGYATDFTYSTAAAQFSSHPDLLKENETLLLIHIPHNICNHIVLEG